MTWITLPRATALSALLLLLWTAPFAAQTAPAPVDVATVGPQVGQTIPDFTLRDQNGKVWTRQSMMGPKGAMIVFFRSADW